MEKEKRINVNVEHGEPVFFSDNVTVSHNQSKFIIDFSQTVPSFDNVAGNMQQSIIIKHKSVLIDPQFAKIFSDLLEKNIKKFEKKFGKIKIPKSNEEKKQNLIETEKSTEKATRYIG
jgi:hypothetical protein